MVEKIYINWTEVMAGIAVLELQLKNSKEEFDGIYAIPRGGLILGVILSHRLNLPLIDKPTKQTLVIDDISDTGETLKDMLHKKIACLYSSMWTVTYPDYYAFLKTQKESWIIFPWENKDTEVMG